MDWFRFYGESKDDPKIKRIARELKRPYYEVLGAWTVILCWASDSPVRGALMLTETEPLTADDLADYMGCDVELAREFIGQFSRSEMDMLALDDGVISVSNWDARQHINDTSAERTREYRRRKRAGRQTKSPEDETPPDPSVECDGHGDVTVTGCDGHGDVTVTPPESESALSLSMLTHVEREETESETESSSPRPSLVEGTARAPTEVRCRDDDDSSETILIQLYEPGDVPAEQWAELASMIRESGRERVRKYLREARKREVKGGRVLSYVSRCLENAKEAAGARRGKPGTEDYGL